MPKQSDYLPSRRHVLSCGGFVLLGSLAGCSGSETDTPAESEENVSDTGAPEQQDGDTTPSPSETEDGCGPGETAIDSLPGLNTTVTVTGEITRLDAGANLLYITDGTGTGEIRAGGRSNAEDYAEGDCVTATGYVTDTTARSGNPDGAVFAYEVRTPAEIERDVLNQSIPDPTQYINSRQSEFERAVGTVEITTTTGEGELRLQGPGQNQVTAIAGYLDGGGLFTLPNWGGSVDGDSKLIYTSAGEGHDDLEFDVFRGIALRAVDGINLVVDGTTVARSVELIQYHEDTGVVEQEPVE